MKNFSAKTADFDSISISGEAPIVQSDLGTAPNQIPLNKDLGTLAYMDSSGVEDVNADTIELREIAAELSETAVDVFVYDTRKDSDGGAWRSRTSHTSWYNEELNTATRGGRREFPAVAVIVAEANKVTIYDGDDPDLSMWMVFNQGGSAAATANLIGPTQATSTSVFMLNGVILVTENAWGAGLISANFISEGFIHYWQASKKYNGNISQRNDSMGYSTGYNEVIISGQGNDVAMTVLPNAPIDDDTGLPVPTIAVATDGGVSVIKDDGSVVDLYRANGDEYCSTITFDSNNSLFVSWGVNNSSYRHVSYWASIPNSNDTELTDNYYTVIKNRGGSFAGDGGTGNVKISNHARAFAVTDNFEKLTLLDHNDLDTSKSQFCDITSTYNTGWMPGDIKLATLSDTKVEKVGEDESTELVTNGEFDNGTTGWEQNATSWSVVNGEAVNSTLAGNLDQEISCIAGNKYVVSFDITQNFADGQNGVYVRYGNGSPYVDKRVQDGSTGSFNITFVATEATHIIRLYRGTNSGTIAFDNISVRQTGELITNGTFDNGTEGWIADRGTISENNSVLQLSQTTGDNAYAYQDIDGFIVGKKYVISFELRGVDTSANMFGMVKDLVSNTELISREYVSSGFNGPFVKKYHSFVASSGSLRVFFMINTSTDNLSLEVDNISVRLAEDDRSVNDNGLQVFGEIDKTPVAPGADLVAYSGFSAENYLMQPYNPDLDFGTGDFCYMGWVYLTANTDFSNIFDTGYAQNEYISLGIGTSGQLYFRTRESGVSADVVSSGTVPLNTWTFICGTRTNTGAVQTHYINGKHDNSATVMARDISGADYPTIVGLRSDGNKPFLGSLALLRISATAPTADQIAKIYRDEKPLFQDGAQATLYGTSDAVTALAYDDSENLLHVGTVSGRSSFSGLKRVENTDVAVTTAISATEGLVIEQ